MKMEKSLSTNQKQEKQQVQNRRNLLWTREKINQLIELYKKHDCLWNHWHESYKSKEKRNRAINDICSTLRVTKFEFGKKIHNLRNQFNTEMKKLEQRIEEAGVSLDDATTTSELRCKWSHFDSLMFLRQVIEPRPAGFQSNFQASKKIRLKFDLSNTENENNFSLLGNNNGCNSSNANTATNPEDLRNYQCNDNDNEEAVTDDFQSFDNDSDDVIPTASHQEVCDQKYRPPPQLANDEHTAATLRSFSNNSKKRKPSSARSLSSSQTEIINVNEDASSIIELNASTVTAVPTHTLTTTTDCSTSISTPVIASITSGNSITRHSPVARDQWDAFGELVANEFRNLNSELSRKLLKRKIMKAMLEIGEEDDTLTAKFNRSK